MERSGIERFSLEQLASDPFELVAMLRKFIVAELVHWHTHCPKVGIMFSRR